MARDLKSTRGHLWTRTGRRTGSLDMSSWKLTLTSVGTLGGCSGLSYTLQWWRHYRRAAGPVICIKCTRAVLTNQDSVYLDEEIRFSGEEFTNDLLGDQKARGSWKPHGLRASPRIVPSLSFDCGSY
ncbi:hypothetical protein EDD15DRAFT_2194829 [Pisolithus albus]|nr:hypothetical protein EDD15DRAFT_2194829 [Pisolithus albus]